MNHFYNIYYFIDKFDSNEILNLNKRVNLIYRNYQNINPDIEIKKIKYFCKLHKRKIFISNNLKMALKYDLDGLYIPSFNKNLNYKNISFKKNFKIIGSAHSQIEVKIKEKQGCSFVFISPIFKTPKKSLHLGIIKFNLISLNSLISTIALGGINQENIKQLNCTNIKGFAGISWIKKTGLQ